MVTSEQWVPWNFERDKVQQNLDQFLNIIIVVYTVTVLVLRLPMNREFHETVDDGLMMRMIAFYIQCYSPLSSRLTVIIYDATQLMSE